MKSKQIRTRTIVLLVIGLVLLAGSIQAMTPLQEQVRQQYISEGMSEQEALRFALGEQTASDISKFTGEQKKEAREIELGINQSIEQQEEIKDFEGLFFIGIFLILLITTILILIWGYFSRGRS